MYAIIISSHEIFRKGIRYTLSHGLPKLVTEECEQVHDFTEKVKRYEPDLVIIDLEGQDTDQPSLVQSLKQDHPNTKVIVFSTEHQQAAIFSLLESGVEGYLFKDNSGEEVVKAVRSVTEGKNYYDQRVVTVMHHRLVNAGTREVAYPSTSLTRREKEILQLICQEHTNKEIGNLLSISRRTVDGHRNRLMKKCGAKNTAGLIYYAIEQGFTVSRQRSA